MRRISANESPRATALSRRPTGPARRLLLTAPLLLALWVAVTEAAHGQEGPVTFEFSFSNPGARSMGLAGAFAALADDATAAFANPAGLVQLIEPEVSVEGRRWDYDNEFVQGGRASGTPSGEGIDTVPGLRRGISSSERDGLSFASVVLPVKRWSFALYRHTWADFALRSEVDGLFAVVEGEVERSEDVQARTDVEVINTGLAIAFEVTDRFSIGLGAAHYDAQIDSFSEEYTHEDEAFFERNPFTRDLLDTTYSYRASDTGVVLHAGLFLQVTDQWSLGAFFRGGPELDLRVLEVVGPAGDESPEGTIDLDTVTPLRLPDVYGAGIAFRTRGGAFTLGFEWARVGYSSITDGLDANVFDPGQIRLEDGDELRVGIEYVVVRARPIVALRLGAWRDPAHSVGSGPDADIFERAIFQQGSDETHLAAGFGLVFQRFQVDVGADLSDEVDLYSVSFVIRF